LPGQGKCDGIAPEKAALIHILIDVKSGISLVDEGLHKVLEIIRFPISQGVEPRDLEMRRLFREKRLYIQFSPVESQRAQEEFEGQGHALA
jgi:hypothetical protein